MSTPTASSGTTSPPRRLIVAITGASGAVYGVRLLQALRDTPGVQTHVTVSDAGWLNLRHELDLGPGDLEPLAHAIYPVADVGAAIASGSFRADAMAIAPCSMRTLAAVAHGLADNLITRAADVMLKERRSLIVVPRETPLSIIHLENLTALARAGATVLPAMPSFYGKPTSIDDVLRSVVGRVLDHLGLEHDLSHRWGEKKQ